MIYVINLNQRRPKNGREIALITIGEFKPTKKISNTEWYHEQKNTFRTTARAKTLLLSLTLTAITSGCSSTDDSNRVDRDNQNSLISQFYATVQSVNAVKLTSNADEGMVNSAFIGLIESLDGDSEDM